MVSVNRAAFNARQKERRKNLGFWGRLFSFLTEPNDYFSEEGDVSYTLPQEGMYIRGKDQRRSETAQRNVRRYVKNRDKQNNKPG